MKFEFAYRGKKYSVETSDDCFNAVILGDTQETILIGLTVDEPRRVVVLGRMDFSYRQGGEGRITKFTSPFKMPTAVRVKG